MVKSRPTSLDAVHADLLKRADFRGISESGRVHYLLGMCEALLADANRELTRLETKPSTWQDELAARFPDGVPADYHLPGSDF